MSYKFLIITTDYLAFLRWFYAKYPGLDKKSYDEQIRLRRKSLFQIADFYCDNLRVLGHDASEIYTNNEFAQKNWAREHDVKSIFLKFGGLFRNHRFWLYKVLKAQIKSYKPDVLINHSMNSIDVDFLRDIKPYTRCIIGQHAATKLPEYTNWGCYDLVVSSFPSTIDWFRQKGIKAELNRLAFEPRILGSLSAVKNPKFDITFIGSLHKVHSSRALFLQQICDKFNNVKIWCPDIGHLPPESSIRKCYMGQAWGRQMFEILQNSKITLNHHGDIPSYANNMRLFEATGVGTLLITDFKENLSRMFEPGKEVAAYSSIKECIELIKYYLENNDKRSAIALAGQKRTLREHTYKQRMKDLIDMIHRFFN